MRPNFLRLSTLVVGISGFAHVAGTQTPPVRELQSIIVRSTETFSNIFGIRQLPDGRVLLNDGVRRQLLLLDRNLSHPVVLLDSTSDGAHSYGVMAAPIIPYVGDSTLFVDGASRSLLVIDPLGRVVRTMAAPQPADLRRLLYVQSFADSHGNLSYQIAGSLVTMHTTDEATGNSVNRSHQTDSSVIVRANFETRVVDSIGRLKQDNSSRTVITISADGRRFCASCRFSAHSLRHGA